MVFTWIQKLASSIWPCLKKKWIKLDGRCAPASDQLFAIWSSKIKNLKQGWVDGKLHQWKCLDASCTPALAIPKSASMFMVVHACDKDLFYLGNCDLNSPSKSSISNNISSSSLTHNSRCFRSTSPCNSRQPFWPCRLTRTLIILSYGEWGGLNRAASRLWSPRVDFWEFHTCFADLILTSAAVFAGRSYRGTPITKSPHVIASLLIRNSVLGWKLPSVYKSNKLPSVYKSNQINPKSTFEVHRNTNLKLLPRVYNNTSINITEYIWWYGKPISYTENGLKLSKFKSTSVQSEQLEYVSTNYSHYSNWEITESFESFN